MRKILDNKFMILLLLTILSVVLDLILCLSRAYEELFLTILTVGLVSIAFSLICFLKKKVYFNYIALLFGIAMVVLLILFPSYYCFSGLILYPVSLILTIVFTIIQ